MIYGVDASYANGLPDWTAALATGKIQFAFNRATYGTNPDDDDGESFVHNHDALKAANVPFGTYTFYLFGQDGAAQAEHLLAAANGRYGPLVPVVDVEEGSAVLGDGGTTEQRIANLAAFSTRLEHYLARPMIYTNADTWARYFGNTDAFSGHWAYIASPSDPPGSPTAIPGLPKVAVHQYAFGAPMAGFAFPPGVDLDVLVGASLADLTR